MTVLGNRGKIICHPNNKTKFEAEINKFTIEYKSRIGGNEYVYNPIPVKIEFEVSLLVDEFEHDKWERESKSSNRFYEMVSDEDLLNPKDWQIFFGYVKEILKPVYYWMDDLYNTSYIFNPFSDNLSHVDIKRTKTIGIKSNENRI